MKIMSNVTTRRFVVLSQSVNTSDDVFNNLVEVQDKETGEQGTLLCSHMCQWPVNLINQATWLEGCKTPEQFKDEPRLALGYHPDQYTQWRVFKETNEIEIYLTGCWTQQGDVDRFADDEENWFHINLPYVATRFGYANDDNQVPHHSLFSRGLIRLAERTLTNTITQESLNDFECLIHRLFNSGRIDAWTATVFPSSMLSRDLSSRICCDNLHWEGSPSIFLGGRLRAFLDGGIYSPNSSYINREDNTQGDTDGDF